MWGRNRGTLASVLIQPRRGGFATPAAQTRSDTFASRRHQRAERREGSGRAFPAQFDRTQQPSLCARLNLRDRIHLHVAPAGPPAARERPAHAQHPRLRVEGPAQEPDHLVCAHVRVRVHHDESRRGHLQTERLQERKRRWQRNKRRRRHARQRGGNRPGFERGAAAERRAGRPGRNRPRRACPLAESDTPGKRSGTVSSRLSPVLRWRSNEWSVSPRSHASGRCSAPGVDPATAARGC